MMTPEQKFARWIRVSIATFPVIFAWFVVADIWIPLVSDSMVMRMVTLASLCVSGYVSQVHVHNNSQAKKGDLLYELDPTPFINRVEAAQIVLEQTKLSNQRLDVQTASARANLRIAQLNAHNDKTTLDRYQRLSIMQNVSQLDLDKVRTARQISEQPVVALNASIQNLLIQRGEHDDKRNVTPQKYRNALEEAQLNPGRSKVLVRTDGTVSNLQLSPGLHATAAIPLLVLVSHQADIVADFREKSLHHTRVNTDVAVVFDAMPGKIFPVHVTSSDAGILVGQEQVNGQLPQPEQSIRWVRDAQRMRIHAALNESLNTPLLTGAHAMIQLYNSEGMLARILAGAQIHLVSWLHYVY